MSASTGFRPAANPLTSAFSQITLIVRGMPRDSWWIVTTASRVKISFTFSPPAIRRRPAM